MKIALIGPGIMPIPPSGWGAVEILIWEYYKVLKTIQGVEVNIINIPNTNEIISKVNSGNYDFAHLHYDVFYHIIPHLTNKNNNLKIAITSHYPYIDNLEMHQRDGYTKIFNFLCKNDKDKSFYIFSLTEKDRNTFIKHGANSNRIFLCKNGASEEFQISDSNNGKVVCLGKIEPRKRQQLLLGIPEVEFIGPCQMNGFIESTKFFKNNYRGEMNKETLYRELSKYKSLILISNGESDPLVVKEGMMAGLGIIVSESSSHMIEKNLNFVDVIPESKINDKEYIRKVINSKEYNKDEIRKYAVKNYSWNNLVKDYYDTICKLE